MPAAGEGGGVVPELGRVLQLVPALRLAVFWRCGAGTRQGPSRLPSAHDAEMSGGVVLCGGGHFLCCRLHRRVQTSHSCPPGSTLNKIAPGCCGCCGCFCRLFTMWLCRHTCPCNRAHCTNLMGQCLCTDPYPPAHALVRLLHFVPLLPNFLTSPHQSGQLCRRVQV